MSAIHASLNSLATATSQSNDFSWTNLMVVIVVAAVAFLGFRWLRPKLREQRRKSWEQAGLLPEQIDPEQHALDERDRLTNERSESSRDEP